MADKDKILDLAVLADSVWRVLVPIVVGMLGGIWLGNHHGHKQLFAVVGTMAGLAGTAILLARLYKAANRGKNS